MTGLQIRQFFRDLLGSRAAEILDAELITIRNLYDERLHEREMRIAELKEELGILKAELEQFKMKYPLPLASLYGPTPKPPVFEPFTEPSPNSWAAIQDRWYREQETENGIPRQERQEPQQQVQSEAGG